MTDFVKTADAPAVSDTEDEIDLSAFFGTIKGARRLIAVCMVLAVFLALVYIWVATPIYEVDGLIQVEDSKGSALGATAKDLEGLFDVQSQGNTEVELLRSRKVLGPVVDELRLNIAVSPSYFPVFGQALARRNEGRWLTQIWSGFNSYAWGGERVSVSQLQVPDEWLNQSLTLVAGKPGSYKILDPDDNLVGEGHVGQAFERTLANGQVVVLVDELQSQEGVNFQVAAVPRTAAITSLADRFMASETGKQSGILKTTLTGADPQLAVRELNAISQQYVLQNVEHRSADAAQTLKYVTEQLPESKMKLEQAEIRLNDYRSRYGILDPEKEGGLLLEQSTNTDTELLELQERRGALLQRYTSEYPDVKVLDQQIATLRGQRDKYAAEVEKLPRTQQELLRLTRDMTVAQDIYVSMLDNAQQLKVVQGGAVGNVRIIDLAEPPLYPVHPKKGLIIALSPMLGFIFGVMAAFLRQRIRSGVRDPRVIEARTGLSVFATVPFSTRQQQLSRQQSRSGGKLAVLAAVDDQDLVVESLRSLRTTLRFAGAKGNKAILICGPAPGMGKSFLSVNLAAVFVATGERVLLIDADMRRGHINEFFGRPRENGLSEVIAGLISLDDVIYKTQIAGLDLISTGAIPPNPSELLLQANFTDLLGALAERYDRIVIDCAPIMAVTDSAIIGHHVGTVLLAVQYEITSQAQLDAAIRRLRQSGVNPTGIVLNCADSSVGDDYKRYAYTYEYRSRKSDL